MRTKAYLLVIETALVAGSIVWLTREKPVPGYDPVADPALRPWLLAACTLAALGLLHAAAGTLCRLLRLRLPAVLDPPAAGLYLLITQTALAFGLLAGPLAAHGRFRELALLTAVSAALAAMLSVLLMWSRQISSQAGTLTTLVTWPASFLLLIVPPLALSLRPDLASIGLRLAMLVPVVDVVIGVRSLPWLLYPFRWRDVFEKQLGVGIRMRLGLLTLIALLPWGGIAVPVWVWTSLSLERHADAG